MKRRAYAFTRLNSRFSRIASIRSLVFAALAFGIIGTILLASSHASTPTASVQTENGIVSNPANIVSDSTASNHTAVKFMQASTSRTTNCLPSNTAAGSVDLTMNSAHLCGFPDVTNTGYKADPQYTKNCPNGLTAVPSQATSGPGWTWTSGGWVSITGSGAVFKCYKVSGLVESVADNVTIEDNDIQGPGGTGYTAAIGLRDAVNVMVRYNNLYGVDPPAERTTFGIDGAFSTDTDNSQIIGNNIYNVDHPIQIDSGYIADNYAHDIGITRDAADHTDVFFSGGGDTLLIIKHNTFINDDITGPTASIMFNNAQGTQTNRIVINNLLAGGNYTIYGGDSAPNPNGGNVCIMNNQFSTALWSSYSGSDKSKTPTSGYYGAYAYTFPNSTNAICNENGLSGSTVSGNKIAGNVWNDGPNVGQAVNP